MTRRLFGRLSGLVRSKRGVSTVEIALLAPFLCIVVMGITDVAQIAALKVRYQQASHRGIELATLGTLQSDSESIREQAATAAGVSPNQVAVTYFLECDGTPMASYAGTCSPGQESARYIRVQVSGTYTPKFNYGPLKRTFSIDNEEGSLPVSGGAVTRIQ